eukprot:14828934-Ditylum_brightwellii.AAC.1
MHHKFITRGTISHAEDHNYLVEEQRGGHNSMTALDIPALNKFSLGTFHLQRANVGKTDCDAKACYDWIDPNLLVMIYSKLGCINKVVEVCRSALLQMEYTMITNLGESTKRNICMKQTPIAGIGQGTTDGPPGWTSYTNILVPMYKSEARGYEL